MSQRERGRDIYIHGRFVSVRDQGTLMCQHELRRLRLQPEPARGLPPFLACRSPPRRSRSAALFVAKVCHLHRGCLHLDLVACAVGDRATPGWARCPAVARLPSLSCCSATGVAVLPSSSRSLPSSPWLPSSCTWSLHGRGPRHPLVG